MARWRLVFGALVLLAGSVGSTGAARTGTPTTLSMTITQTGGGVLAGADVAVYYSPFNPAKDESDPQMATGTTNSAGQADIALNTTMVQTSDLGNQEGHQVFNALVVAETSARTAVEAVVVKYQGTTAGTATAQVDPASITGTPSLPAQLKDNVVGSAYRYVTIAALNSTNGVQVGLQYTWTADTSRQTTIGVAGSFEGEAWSAHGSMIEQTSRSINAPWRKWQVYHRFVFANYFFQKHFVQLGIKAYEYLWEPNHFAGQVTDYDPNIQQDGSVIGNVPYTVPKFTNCDGNCWFVLTRENSGWGRDSGTRLSYRFDMAVANWLSLDTEATFGSVTYVHWYWQSKGCSGSNSRVIWGDDLDPGAARIIQANCMPTPHR